MRSRRAIQLPLFKNHCNINYISALRRGDRRTVRNGIECDVTGLHRAMFARIGIMAGSVRVVLLAGMGALLLLVLFLLGMYAGMLTERMENGFVLSDWMPNPSQSVDTSPALAAAAPVRLLSYQPPGNGWNNQRIAIENALVLARLLDRTLLVHPLAPHKLGEETKMTFPHGRRHGYLAYNKMNSSNLAPLSKFMDLKLMSQLVPVEEVQSPHPQFLKDYSHLRWRRVCHSMGYGFWVDQRPTPSSKEETWLSHQHFVPNKSWREKCTKEAHSTQVARYVSDLFNDSSEMLYFEEGSLFGIQIRFTTLKRALEAQQWVLKYVQYSRTVKTVAAIVGQRLGQYNAMHIRRVGHIAKKISRKAWLKDMILHGFRTDVPVYIATDEPKLSWFKPLSNAGYKIFFAANFSDILSFSHIPATLRQDMLGIHEQEICEQADKFLPSLSSTFAAYIRRQRGEVDQVDGLYTDTLHTSWIKHTTVNQA